MYSCVANSLYDLQRKRSRCNVYYWHEERAVVWRWWRYNSMQSELSNGTVPAECFMWSHIWRVLQDIPTATQSCINMNKTNIAFSLLQAVRTATKKRALNVRTATVVVNTRCAQWLPTIMAFKQAFAVHLIGHRYNGKVKKSTREINSFITRQFLVGKFCLMSNYLHRRQDTSKALFFCYCRVPLWQGIHLL